MDDIRLSIIYKKACRPGHSNLQKQIIKSQNHAVLQAHQCVSTLVFLF